MKHLLMTLLAARPAPDRPVQAAITFRPAGDLKGPVSAADFNCPQGSEAQRASSRQRVLLRKLLLAAGLTVAVVTDVSAQFKITAQPKDRFVDSGKYAYFTVFSPEPPPVTYHWYFNSFELAGATNSTLALTNVQPAQTGGYSAVVSNPSGSVTSAVARLKVFVPASHEWAGIVPMANRSIPLTLAGETTGLFGPYYDLYPIEVSSNLVNWVPLVTLVRTNAAWSPLNYVDSTAPGSEQRFYRTVTNLLLTPLPPLTGPYPVGTFSRLMSDPSRTNRVRRTNQQFMVTFPDNVATLPDGRPDDRKLVIDRMTHDGYFVKISGTSHASYTDFPLTVDRSLFESLFGGGQSHPLIPGVRVNQIASTYVVSFFKKYLMDQDDHLLDGPPPEFPEVIEFVKK